MSTQFIACACEGCQFNDSTQCRATYILVGDKGDCKALKNNIGCGKSNVETYVELKECQNPKCRHWEKEAETGVGVCGYATDLFFNLKGVCEEFDTQPQEPGFPAIL